MSTASERLLHRGSLLLATHRHREALQAYRSALQLCRDDARAHIGVAWSEAGLGQSHLAIARLTATARDLVARGLYGPALKMFAEATQIDPSRLELHLDIAEVQIATGDLAGATATLERLADAYVDAGRVEDARAIVEFAAQTAASVDVVGAPIPAQTGITEPIIVYVARPPRNAGTGVPRPIAIDRTVQAKTLLRLPDGSPMPGQAPLRPRRRSTPKFRVQSPPRLRRPPPLAR